MCYDLSAKLGEIMWQYKRAVMCWILTSNLLQPRNEGNVIVFMLMNLNGLWECPYFHYGNTHAFVRPFEKIEHLKRYVHRKGKSPCEATYQVLLFGWYILGYSIWNLYTPLDDITLTFHTGSVNAKWGKQNEWHHMNSTLLVWEFRVTSFIGVLRFQL